MVGLGLGLGLNLGGTLLLDDRECTYRVLKQARTRTNEEVAGGKGRKRHTDDSRDYRDRLYGCSRVKPGAEYRYGSGQAAWGDIC